MRFISFNLSQDSQRFFDLLKNLRPQLTIESFKDLYTKAHKEGGYEIIGLEKDNELVGLMGFRIITDFVHGRHLYIDDLITSEFHRSGGLGAQMLDHAEVLAKENHCSNLRLCTGIENERGKNFYEKNGWNLRAVAFKKKIP